MIRSQEELSTIHHLEYLVLNEATPKKIFVLDGKFNEITPLRPRIVFADSLPEAEHILISQIKGLNGYKLNVVHSEDYLGWQQIDDLKEEYHTDNIYCKIVEEIAPRV
ncbi:MAG TPA: hypothetical protein VJI75_00275 [Candidatus Nanoarchaeia archaeon]|nr:hypothetical protein [Candidatus Nanoarchaeia archaeon]